MIDLISREALLEVLTKYKFGAIKSNTEREYTKETVLSFVKEQPSVTDTNVGSKWIPCSERLPEEFSDYLATLEGGYVEILEYDTYFYEWNDVHGHTLNNEHVIAWMPLPEPYKGE